MSSLKPEWKEKQEISLEDYFALRFTEAVKYAKLLVDQIGEEKAYEILDKNSIEEGKEYGKELMKDRPLLASVADLSEFWHRLYSEPFWDKCLEVEYLDESDNYFRYNVKKCIWAHTFSKLGASELGYHTMCMGDYGIATGLSPYVTLKRSKTLMQGDDCCDFAWHWEGD